MGRLRYLTAGEPRSGVDGNHEGLPRASAAGRDFDRDLTVRPGMSGKGRRRIEQDGVRISTAMRQPRDRSRCRSEPRLQEQAEMSPTPGATKTPVTVPGGHRSRRGLEVRLARGPPQRVFDGRAR
jgi:hypothetical protein